MPMEEFDLSGQVAVVTGGSRGIGRAIGLGLAAAGADVVPVSRTTADVEEAVEEIRDRGAESLVVTADVGDPDAVGTLFETVVGEFGGVDVVVNNAGINPEAALGKPDDVDPAAFADTVAVNLTGAYTCAHEAATHLVEGGGCLINVASVGGIVGLPRQHPYVGSKHGLVGITRSMALDLAPTVRVNCIAPGYVATAFIEEAIERDRLRESLLDRTPLDRFADPGELAGPAVFLASDAASYVTGAVLAVDGGWTAR